MQGSAASAVVRPYWNDAVLFKRLLDIGVQSLLVPFVQSADEARLAVAATRYPPEGIRGVATTMRANRYARANDDMHRAHDEIGVIVQVETPQAIAHVEAIAASTAWTACSSAQLIWPPGMSHLGDNSHPRRARRDRARDPADRATGKCAGILAPVEADARHWRSELGCLFVGVGNDTASSRVRPRRSRREIQVRRFPDRRLSAARRLHSAAHQGRTSSSGTLSASMNTAQYSTFTGRFAGIHR
jgi:4-hydroxy-2-oxoheptanedioate aldolase